MFVCPKCGFEELPCWRNNRWQPYGQICKIHELEVFNPELTKKLKEEIKVEDQHYYYQLTKTGWVHRIRKEFKNYWVHGHYTEAAKVVDPQQKKLFQK